MPLGIDTDECLRRGCIGAFGAMPGTIAAHPCDVIKMRMQVTGAGLQPTLSAIRATPGGFYRGLGAGIGQKVLTRGPMFLASEACTQLCMRFSGLERQKALFIGSFGSGYLTGFFAASAEWAKVQRATL